jgi:hypothetical protein
MPEDLDELPTGCRAIGIQQMGKPAESLVIQNEVNIAQFTLETMLPTMKYSGPYTPALEFREEAADKLRQRGCCVTDHNFLKKPYSLLRQ